MPKSKRRAERGTSTGGSFAAGFGLGNPANDAENVLNSFLVGGSKKTRGGLNRTHNPLVGIDGPSGSRRAPAKRRRRTRG